MNAKDINLNSKSSIENVILHLEAKLTEYMRYKVKIIKNLVLVLKIKLNFIN